jgi:hypothetical protein
MTLLQIAALIPAEYRSEILKLNMIQQAKADTSNTTMHYLLNVWKEYVEPGIDPGCGICLSRVLNNLKELQPHLVELERNNNLLKSL